MIDPHAHIGAFKAIEKIIPKLRRKSDFPAWRTKYPEVWNELITEKAIDNCEALVEAMDRNGVDVTLVQPTPNVSTEFVRNAAARFPERLVPMGQPTRWPVGLRPADGGDTAPFTDGDGVHSGGEVVAQRTEYYFRELGMRAIGEVNTADITLEIDPRLIARDFDPMMEVLAAYRAPVQILTAWTQFPGGLYYGDALWVDEVACRHPNVPIVLTKMGRGIQRYFDSAMTVALRNSNVYLDISGTTAEHFSIALDALGPDRIMFATDWSYTWRYLKEPADIHMASIELVRDVVEDAGAVRQICSGTAAKVFEQALASAKRSS